MSEEKEQTREEMIAQLLAMPKEWKAMRMRKINQARKFLAEANKFPN